LVDALLDSGASTSYVATKFALNRKMEVKEHHRAWEAITANGNVISIKSYVEFEVTAFTAKVGLLMNEHKQVDGHTVKTIENGAHQYKVEAQKLRCHLVNRLPAQVLLGRGAMYKLGIHFTIALPAFRHKPSHDNSLTPVFTNMFLRINQPEMPQIECAQIEAINDTGNAILVLESSPTIIKVLVHQESENIISLVSFTGENVTRSLANSFTTENLRTLPGGLDKPLQPNLAPELDEVPVEHHVLN